LLAVWRLRGSRPTGIKALAQHLHVAGPHVTDEVAGLVRRGYLAKEIDKKDNRAVSLTLTPRGQQTLKSLAPHLDRVNQTLFDGMNNRDMLLLRQHFQTLISRSAACIAELRNSK
jgi:DNA-binding MarR family transcriptional regulator